MTSHASNTREDLTPAEVGLITLGSEREKSEIDICGSSRHFELESDLRVQV